MAKKKARPKKNAAGKKASPKRIHECNHKTGQRSQPLRQIIQWIY